MSSGQERNTLQRTVLFGMLFVILLLLAVLAGYMFLGRPPAAAPTTAPPPVDNTTPSATPDALPPAPSDLTAEDVAVYDILVGWKDNSDNEDGFNVYRQRTDVAGDLIKAGSTGANTTNFTDPYTYCGETYEYIIASYNSIGESPTEVCWSITLPPCPDPKSLTQNAGVDKGYNFLTGAVGTNSDFYLNSPTGAVPSFMADQGGQHGVLDLGEIGDVPLWHVDLPRPPDYVREGVQTVEGHTYAALATDGVSVVVSTVESAGPTANLKYIVWKPGDEKTGECTVGRQGRDPSPPKTCECRDGGIQVAGIAAVATDRRCAQDPNATCECHGDDLVFSTNAVFARDPICTGSECECQGPNWVCSNGFTVQSSVRCVEQTEPPCTGPDCVTATVPVTEPPPSCACQGTTWVCTDGTSIPNYQRCIQSTEPPTEPPPDQQCFCEVSGGGWNGDWVCTTLDGKELSRVHDEGRCPVQVCGNGSVEGAEECDGGGCKQGATCKSDCTCSAQVCTCECIQTSSAVICRDSCTGKTCRP